LREFRCGTFAGQEGPERGKPKNLALLKAVARERLLRTLEAREN
jgi:hypothetical protein